MKNIQNTEEDLRLFDGNGERVYDYYNYLNGFSCEYTYDERGNLLSYKNSKGASCEYTYDERNNRLTYKNSKGFSCESTFDENNTELTYSDSNEVKRGFNVPEYTMAELTAKLGNFKLIK